MKNPLTPAGIEPATFQFVSQHLNHCATAVPTLEKYGIRIKSAHDTGTEGQHQPHSCSHQNPYVTSGIPQHGDSTNCSNTLRNIHTNARENITKTHAKWKAGFFFVAHSVYSKQVKQKGLIQKSLDVCELRFSGFRPSMKILMPLFKPFMNGCDESGYMADESASPTLRTAMSQIILSPVKLCLLLIDFECFLASWNVVLLQSHNVAYLTLPRMCIFY